MAPTSPGSKLSTVFVIDYHPMLLATIQPGMTVDEILLEATQAVRPRIDTARLERDTHRTAVEWLLEYRGSLSHTVGMAVHDVGDYSNAPLRPGTVFSVDPQLWVCLRNASISVSRILLWLWKTG